MTKQATAATQREKLIETSKEKVQRLLSWDDLQYGRFKEKMAFRYLRCKGYDEAWIDELTRSKSFWQWWRNQWNIREDRYLRSVWAVSNGQHALMVDMYIGSNSPSYLSFLKIDPHWMETIMKELVDLDNTEAVMMQQFIDEINQQPC